MDLRPQTLPIDKVGSSVWFRSTREKIMFIKDDILGAYVESYYGSSYWEVWDDTYLVWPELLEVW